MRRLLQGFVMWFSCWPILVSAQGILIVDHPDESARLPRPILIEPRPVTPPTLRYKIQQLRIDTRLNDQTADVQVSQTFVNTGRQPMEASFVFPLPYDGAIDRMTLLVDGQEWPAKLLNAEQARRMYEEIVRRNRDPALLEWLGTGLFRTRVFPVPAGARRTVSLRYHQLCRRQAGMTDFLLPLSTAQYTSEAIENIEIRATIESRDEIKNLYSPTHPVEIERPDGQHATVVFKTKKDVPAGDFRLLYDVGARQLGARLLSYRPDAGQDGFFLLLASPQLPTARAAKPSSPISKTVLLVIDRSGSMSGQKLEQVKAALKTVLNNLHSNDLFNIVAYDDRVDCFRPELQRFNEKTRQAATGFVEGLYAGGTTDLDAAMRTALNQIQDSQRPNYVIFLTDGLPTAGETNAAKIVENAKRRNPLHARVLALGVGYDVNSRLLDKLVRENFGQSEYVRPNEDIEARVAALYRRIESPVLTGVRLRFTFDANRDEEGNPINRVYPKDSFDLFAGEQLVLVGRYRKSGSVRVGLEGAIDGRRKTFDFAGKLTAHSDDEQNAFIEKLWAMRRVGEILDQIDLHGKNDELVQELVDLATRHGILTPYTSFMTDENVGLHAVSNYGFAGKRLEALRDASGASGFAQRAMKGALQNTSQATAAASKPFSLSSAEASSNRVLSEAHRESQRARQNIRHVGPRTFFRRDDQWIDSQVTEEQRKNIRRIKQFSDEYFKLAETHGRRWSQYLVFDEPVLLSFDRQAYLIEP